MNIKTLVTCIIVLFILRTQAASAAENGNQDRFTMNECTRFAKANPTSISIATFNIGGPGECNGSCVVNRVKDMKRLLFEVNQLDIVGFQEVKIIDRGNNSQKPYIEPEFIQFESQFAEYNRVFRGHWNIVGNPPPGWESRPREGMNGGSWYGNMIVTKFPIREGSYREHLFGGEKYPRYLISVIVETPNGPLRTYNIHTRGYPESESAYGVKQVVTFLQKISSSEPDIPFVVLGDFNHEYGKIAAIVANLGHGLGINMGCENATLCYLKGIDFLFTGNKALLQNRCKVESTPDNKFFGADHDPVYATVSLGSMAQKPGDLDRNGRVDIFDYNNFLNLFGRTGSPRFDPADINGNGAVDIFDYNEMLKALATP